MAAVGRPARGSAPLGLLAGPLLAAALVAAARAPIPAAYFETSQEGRNVWEESKECVRASKKMMRFAPFQDAVLKQLHDALEAFDIDLKSGAAVDLSEIRRRLAAFESRLGYYQQQLAAKKGSLRRTLAEKDRQLASEIFEAVAALRGAVDKVPEDVAIGGGLPSKEAPQASARQKARDTRRKANHLTPVLEPRAVLRSGAPPEKTIPKPVLRARGSPARLDDAPELVSSSARTKDERVAVGSPDKAIPKPVLRVRGPPAGLDDAPEHLSSSARTKDEHVAVGSPETGVSGVLAQGIRVAEKLLAALDAWDQAEEAVAEDGKLQAWLAEVSRTRYDVARYCREFCTQCLDAIGARTPGGWDAALRALQGIAEEFDVLGDLDVEYSNLAERVGPGNALGRALRAVRESWMFVAAAA